MRVAELRYPGHFPTGMSPDEAGILNLLLNLCERHLADAAVALAMFERALTELPRGRSDGDVLGDYPEVLDGDRFAYTVASGHIRGVAVSEATLTIAQQAVQAAFDAFSWNGSPRTVP